MDTPPPKTEALDSTLVVTMTVWGRQSHPRCKWHESCIGFLRIDAEAGDSQGHSKAARLSRGARLAEAVGVASNSIARQERGETGIRESSSAVSFA